MPNAAIAIDRLQTLQVALQFPAQIAFDQKFARRNRLNDFVDLLRRKIFRPEIRIDVRLFENALRRRGPDSVNVSERSFDALLGWNFYSQ